MNGNITKKRKLNRSPLDGDYDDDEKNRNRMKSAVGALEENHDENFCNFESIRDLVNEAIKENSNASKTRHLIANFTKKLLRRYQHLQRNGDRYHQQGGVGCDVDPNTKKFSMRLVHHRVDQLIEPHRESSIDVLDALISGCGADDEKNLEKLKQKALSRRLMDVGIESGTIDDSRDSALSKTHRGPLCTKRSHICDTWKAELEKDMKDISNPFILQMKVFSQYNATESLAVRAPGYVQSKNSCEDKQGVN